MIHHSSWGRNTRNWLKLSGLKFQQCHVFATTSQPSTTEGKYDKASVTQAGLADLFLDSEHLKENECCSNIFSFHPFSTQKID